MGGYWPSSTAWRNFLDHQQDETNQAVKVLIKQVIRCDFCAIPYDPIPQCNLYIIYIYIKQQNGRLLHCSSNSWSLFKPFLSWKIITRWFKVTFSCPSWRSLNPWKGHLTIPKRSQRIARHASFPTKTPVLAEEIVLSEIPLSWQGCCCWWKSSSLHPPHLARILLPFFGWWWCWSWWWCRISSITNDYILLFRPTNDETRQVRQQSWESKVPPPKATPQ